MNNFSKILIIANKLGDRLRLIKKLIDDQYAQGQVIYFFNTRNPKERIKGMQDIEDELNDIARPEQIIINRRSDPWNMKIRRLLVLIKTPLSFIVISEEFKRNIAAIVCIYFFCFIKRIKIIYCTHQNTLFDKGLISVKDIAGLFSFSNVKRYYFYLHDAVLMKLGLGVYVKYPRSIVIEPTTACNLHCTLCPRGQNILNRSMSNMDVDAYKKFTQGISLFVDSIYFTLYGEPLLHNRIIEMLSYAKESGIPYVELSTNANIRKDQIFYEQLILSGLDCINIAVDSLQQGTYNEYRKGGNVDDILYFIDQIVSAKKKHRMTRPILRAQILELKQNENERNTMRKVLLEHGVDNVFIKPVVDFTLQSNEQLALYKPLSNMRSTLQCKALFTTMVIASSGDLMLCCLDYAVTMGIGNVFNGGYKEFSNKKFRNLRRIFLKDKKQILLCANCIEHNKKSPSIA